MKIEKKTLMNNPLGLVGACAAASRGIVCAYLIDNYITVLERSDGTFGFWDHIKDKEPTKKLQKEIIKAIKAKG